MVHCVRVHEEGFPFRTMRMYSDIPREPVIIKVTATKNNARLPLKFMILMEDNTKEETTDVCQEENLQQLVRWSKKIPVKITMMFHQHTEDGTKNDARKKTCRNGKIVTWCCLSGYK